MHGYGYCGLQALPEVDLAYAQYLGQGIPVSERFPPCTVQLAHVSLSLLRRT
jgi:hypothetical protein